MNTQQLVCKRRHKGSPQRSNWVTSFVSYALQKQPLNHRRQQQPTHLLEQWRIRSYLFSFFSYAIGFALEMKKKKSGENEHLQTRISNNTTNTYFMFSLLCIQDLSLFIYRHTSRFTTTIGKAIFFGHNSLIIIQWQIKLKIYPKFSYCSQKNILFFIHGRARCCISKNKVANNVYWNEFYVGLKIFLPKNSAWHLH